MAFDIVNVMSFAKIPAKGVPKWKKETDVGLRGLLASVDEGKGPKSLIYREVMLHHLEEPQVHSKVEYSL